MPATRNLLQMCIAVATPPLDVGEYIRRER